MGFGVTVAALAGVVSQDHPVEPAVHAATAYPSAVGFCPAEHNP